MGVPIEIRNVERPVNTVVVDNKVNGPHRWAVRERAFVTYAPGLKNPQPHNGKTIGYIIDGKFVPKADPGKNNGENKEKPICPSCLQYGFPALLKTLDTDILDDLLKVFPFGQAYDILVIAEILVMESNCSSSRLSYHYNKTFLQKFYPGCSLSSESVHDLCEEIGADMGRREQFALLRLERGKADHPIIIERTLIQGRETISDIGNFAAKTGINEKVELSVLYAYDAETGEPVCSEVFPGNFADSNAYEQFFRDNYITKGILLTDEEFSQEKTDAILKENPDLHFLRSLKTNDSRIGLYHMLDFGETLLEYNRVILCKREKISNNPVRYLYAYRDTGKAAVEEDLFGTFESKKEHFDDDQYAENNLSSETAIFESDLDLPVALPYQWIDQRSILNLLFKEYASDLNQNETGIQDGFAVIGSDFINFIAVLLISRIIHKIKNETNLFDTFTYGDIKDCLKEAWRTANSPDPVTGDKYWVHTGKDEFLILEQLGLSRPAEVPKPENSARRRTKKAEKETKDTSQEELEEGTGEEKKEPKRPAGRPRKNPPPDPNAPKRPRGRPRKDAGNQKENTASG